MTHNLKKNNKVINFHVIFLVNLSGACQAFFKLFFDRYVSSVRAFRVKRRLARMACNGVSSVERQAARIHATDPRFFGHCMRRLTRISYTCFSYTCL